jgi:BASS family bile acid:Na+ symporter
VLDNPLIAVGLPLINALIMFGIGLTLRLDDFRGLVRHPRATLVGLLGHYLLLPLIGFATAATLATTPEHAVGFMLLAACPSATASNVLTLLARGNVALAVTLTAICCVVTLVSIPLLVNIALAWFDDGTPAMRLPVARTILTLASIVLLPVLTGMAVRRHATALALRAERWMGPVSVLFLLLLIATIAATETALIRRSLPELGGAALAMCIVAIVAGATLARGLRLSMPDAITIALEVGVQNCTLAMVVALTIMKMPLVALPAAIYGLLMFLPAFAVVAVGRRFGPMVVA